MKINTKSSHIKSATHLENEVIPRINSNLTDKTYTYINPDIQQDNLVERAIDDSIKKIHRFKYKCALVVKFNQATHGNTKYFTLTNKLKNQYEEVNEAIKLSHQIQEFQQGESGYVFDNLKKLTVKMLTYKDTRASSYCNYLNHFVAENQL